MIVVLIGMTVVIGAIVLLRMNAFLALVGAAIVVSLLAPGDAAGADDADPNWQTAPQGDC